MCTFGTCYGSQIFQRLSDAVCYVMHPYRFCVISYIDDYIGLGMPDVVHASYDCLFQLMKDLCLSISIKKLVAPSTKVVYLGVLINTEADTVSIPPDKLCQITDTMRQLLTRASCTKHQLQSTLGMSSYIHKCVKPAHAFLNKMLALLGSSHDNQKIILISDFKRDLWWFAKFLLSIIVSFYNHRPIDLTLELDACLTGLEGRWNNFLTIFLFS